MEGAYINIKLIIGNREPGTGSLFLICENVSDISKLKNRKQGIGNRVPETSSLFWYIILMFQKCKSEIRNQFPVPY